MLLMVWPPAHPYEERQTTRRPSSLILERHLQLRQSEAAPPMTLDTQCSTEADKRHPCPCRPVRGGGQPRDLPPSVVRTQAQPAVHEPAPAGGTELQLLVSAPPACLCGDRTAQMQPAPVVRRKPHLDCLDTLPLVVTGTAPTEPALPCAGPEAPAVEPARGGTRSPARTSPPLWWTEAPLAV
ncbi:hypothetical protein WMY93_009140 [Mugilogobius chulae]|uniref:Uncharacterized protein n=1 Tax=Mugilogobius chulae TaxID=88201 RepID=A0AAW0PE38_9GOBI